MKTKDAILVLERIKRNVNNENEEKALRMAILSLETDIPAKVVYEDRLENGKIMLEAVAYCPSCYRIFETDEITWGADYCPDCGRRLDWR